MTTIDDSPVTLTANAAVGSTVNAYLFEAGVTRTKLAHVLGVTTTNASKKVRGTVGWDAEDLAITAAFLGIEVADIMPTLVIENGQKRWIPAPFKPGYAKSPSSGELGDSTVVARAGFEPTTSGFFLGLKCLSFYTFSRSIQKIYQQ